jgi:hypothetical protein
MPTPSTWVKGLVVKSRSQYILYWNIHIHDAILGMVAKERKEELQKAIKDELELGGEGFAEEDLYLLLEINLDYLTVRIRHTNTGFSHYQ